MGEQGGPHGKMQRTVIRVETGRTAEKVLFIKKFVVVILVSGSDHASGEFFPGRKRPPGRNKFFRGIIKFPSAVKRNVSLYVLHDYQIPLSSEFKNSTDLFAQQQSTGAKSQTEKEHGPDTESTSSSGSESKYL